MKKILPLLISIIVFGQLNSFGQKNSSKVVAVFQGNQIALDKEIQSKTISFTLKKLDETSRTNFENTAQKYSNFFTVYYPTIRESKTSQVYILTLLYNTEFKILNRLFVAADITKIEFNGTTMDREEFFQSYMNTKREIIEK